MTLSFNIQAASANNYHPSLNTLHFDRNGNPIRAFAFTKPRPRFHHLIRAERPAFVQPAPEPYSPPYRGLYRLRMEEWSFPRARYAETNRAKFFARQLNDAHSAFLANGLEPETDPEPGERAPDTISLEEYTDALIAYLSEYTECDAVPFLQTIQDKLETGAFCPSGSTVKLSAKLLKAWQRYQADNNIAPAMADEQELLPSVPYTKPKVKVTSSNIELRYRNYLAKAPNAEHELGEVLIAFGKARAADLMFDWPLVDMTPDDCAQEGVCAVWDNLASFNGVSGQFYKWMRKVMVNTIKDGRKSNKKQAGTRAEFLVNKESGSSSSSGDSGDFVDGGVEENPLINCRDDIKRNGGKYRQEPILQFQRELPEFIQGTDLKICMYIRAGKNYAQVAEVLEITEDAVSQRIRKMRERIGEMKLDPNFI